MSEVSVLATKAAFDNALAEAGDKLVVVDFYADWCGPCKMIAPKVVTMAQENKDAVLFYKVNVDENDETSESEGISAMPTFNLYKNGAKVDSVTGANESKLRELIAKNK